MRRLGVHEDGAEEETEELRARLVAAHAALARLDELADEDWVRDDTAERVRGLTSFANGGSRSAQARSTTKTASRTAR